MPGKCLEKVKHGIEGTLLKARLGVKVGVNRGPKTKRGANIA
jgi:hypothetical protein